MLKSSPANEIPLLNPSRISVIRRSSRPRVEFSSEDSMAAGECGAILAKSSIPNGSIACCCFCWRCTNGSAPKMSLLPPLLSTVVRGWMGGGETATEKETTEMIRHYCIDCSVTYAVEEGLRCVHYCSSRSYPRCEDQNHHHFPKTIPFRLARRSP